MRLTFIIHTVGAGGAERVLSYLANFWDQKGWEITVLSFDDGSEPPFYDLHPSVHHIPLGLYKKSRNPFIRLKNIIDRTLILRRAIKKSRPQAVISFIDRNNVRTLLSTFGLKIPVIVSERNHPFCEKIPKIWDLLRGWLYRRATAVIVLAPSAIPYFPRKIQKRSKVIPNPVVIPKNNLEQTDKKSNKNNKIVIAMGRLTPQKGFDLLLEAFAKVSNKHLDWSLVIWGEGLERPALEELRDKLGLHDRVHFPGITKKPHEEFRKADLFVLSSRYEGFSNVLCEAMASGLPVISFNCPTSPSEIIRDGIDGVLVPPGNIAQFSTKIDCLMGNPAERKRLAERAPEVTDRFGLNKVIGMWEMVIKDAVFHNNGLN